MDFKSNVSQGTPSLGEAPLDVVRQTSPANTEPQRGSASLNGSHSWWRSFLHGLGGKQSSHRLIRETKS